MTETNKIGYHFTGKTLLDGRPIPAVGEWLVHDGPIIPCKSGLHMCEHPFDALGYAPGPYLHKVELAGDLTQHNDKWVGRRRRITASIDSGKLLGEFDRWVAMRIIHRWNAPSVVRRYLEAGNSDLCDAAEAAVVNAAISTRTIAGTTRAERIAAFARREAIDAAGRAVSAQTALITYKNARYTRWGEAWVAALVADNFDATRDPAGTDTWNKAWTAALLAQRKHFIKLVGAAFAKVMSEPETTESGG